MRRILVVSLVFVLFGFMPFSVFAVGKNDKNKETTITEHVISGKVVDKFSGEPLVGAEVIIEGQNKSTFTDFDGQFCFRGINNEDIKIKAALISYKPGVDKVDPGKEKEEVIIKMSKL